MTPSRAPGRPAPLGPSTGQTESEDGMADVCKPTVPRAGQQDGLRRDLKPRHLQLIALGGIIGSGYFLGAGEVLSTVGPAVVLSYVLTRSDHHLRHALPGRARRREPRVQLVCDV